MKISLSEFKAYVIFVEEYPHDEQAFESINDEGEVTTGEYYQCKNVSLEEFSDVLNRVCSGETITFHNNPLVGIHLRNNTWEEGEDIVFNEGSPDGALELWLYFRDEDAIAEEEEAIVEEEEEEED